MGGVGLRECGGRGVAGVTGMGIQSSRAGGKCPKVRDLLEIKDLLSSAAGGGREPPHPQLYHRRAGFPHWLLQMVKHWADCHFHRQLSPRPLPPPAPG